MSVYRKWIHLVKCVLVELLWAKTQSCNLLCHGCHPRSDYLLLRVQPLSEILYKKRDRHDQTRLCCTQCTLQDCVIVSPIWPRNWWSRCTHEIFIAWALFWSTTCLKVIVCDTAWLFWSTQLLHS